MGRGQGRPSTVGRGVIALAAVAAVAGIWLASRERAGHAGAAPRQAAGAAGTTTHEHRAGPGLSRTIRSSMPSAPPPARSTRTSRSRSAAIGRASPAPPACTESYLESLTRIAPDQRLQSAGSRNCGDVGATTYGITATQTLFNGFQTGNRTRQAEAQVFAARETLRSTEQIGAAERGDRLHEPAARHRAARAAAQQRDRARGDAAADARSLQCRRGDAHRRGAGGIAARRRPLVAADRGIELHHLAGALSAGDRRRARPAGAGDAGRPVLAAHPVRRAGARRAPSIPTITTAMPTTSMSRPIRSRSPRARSIRR